MPTSSFLYEWRRQYKETYVEEDNIRVNEDWDDMQEKLHLYDTDKCTSSQKKRIVAVYDAITTRIPELRDVELPKWKYWFRDLKDFSEGWAECIEQWLIKQINQELDESISQYGIFQLSLETEDTMERYHKGKEALQQLQNASKKQKERIRRYQPSKVQLCRPSLGQEISVLRIPWDNPIGGLMKEFDLADTRYSKQIMTGAESKIKLSSC